MRTIASAALASALAAASFSAAAASYGQPLPAGVAPVAINVALASPDAHDDAPGVFSGRITEVCQNAGCWLVIERDGVSARVNTNHVFLIPKDSQGEAIVAGTLEPVPADPEAAAAATAEPAHAHAEGEGEGGEHAAHHAAMAAEDAARAWRIIATGVEIAAAPASAE
jgi:hypothetical protein